MPFPILPQSKSTLAFMLVTSLSVLSSKSFGQVFQNMAPEWGITQYDWDGIYGAAVSTADWNNDGWPDLTFGSTEGALRTFVNQQGLGFEALPLPWNMGSETKSLMWIDLDNDGDDDLFIQEDSGRCGLLRNEGDGTFTNATPGSNLPQEDTEAAGVSFGDMDDDGDLDLHLCRYLEYPIYGTAADRNVLMRNEGNLTFTNVTEESGIDEHMRLSFQSIWWDQDEDGWQDLFVINDKNGANAMFRNNADGTFTDVAADLNMDLVMDCMTASMGDFNRDGLQDLFLTNTPFGGDGLGSKLLRGMSNGTYVEVSQAHGLNMDRYCWGALWMDVDNDADLDLFVAEHEFLNPYGINYLYENQGAASYYNFEPFGTDVYDIDYLNSHVVASADFDQNGWIDFVVHNIGNHASRIWMNGGFDNGFESVGISLQGTMSNRPAVGSVIEVHTTGTPQKRVVHAGENYLSQENEVELFGLGQDELGYVKVHWPSGLYETFLPDVHGLDPMAQHLLIEGQSPCPQSEILYVSCTDSVEIEIESEVLAPFEASWSNAEGSLLGPIPPQVWAVSLGDLTMTATWEGTTTCTVTHHFVVEPIPGDLDQDGHVATTDVLHFLAELGCPASCTADLDGDDSVGVNDLLVLLTLVGQSCF